jgi:hypothetical protein
MSSADDSNSAHSCAAASSTCQDQQQLPERQALGERIDDGHPCGLAHVQRSCCCGSHQRWLGNRGKLYDPDTVREPVRYLLEHLIGKPCLAHPARPGDGHQPVAAQQFRYLPDGARTADEARGRMGQGRRFPRWSRDRFHPHSHTISPCDNPAT